MDLGLAGKVVFVAGASQGIGYGIAESFLTEGAKVSWGRSTLPLPTSAAVKDLPYFRSAMMTGPRPSSRT